jgi:L-threonylcarbamoyladenylate synthase
MVRVTWHGEVGPWLAPVAQVIREGGVAVIPTDTVYGFAARADRPPAVARIAAAKGRDPDSPFLVLIAGLEGLRALTGSPPPAAVLDVLWPGPVTLLLAARLELAPAFRGPAGTVAVRWPDDPVLHSLLAAIGGPVLSTSVNRRGRPPLSDPAAIAAEFESEIDLLGDGGAQGGSPSTIVDLTRRPPVLLRSGSRAVDPSELERRWKRAEDDGETGGGVA